MNILITGFPRVGKTTLLLKFLKKLQKDCSGFITKEILNESDVRIGFKVIRLSDNAETVLAHVKGSRKERVGKYFVFVKEFEQLIIPELQKKSELVIIDEIGKMELFSEKFKELLLLKMNEGNMIATITKKGGGKFVRELKEREDVKLIELTYNNRNSMLDQLLEYLE